MLVVVKSIVWLVFVVSPLISFHLVSNYLLNTKEIPQLNFEEIACNSIQFNSNVFHAHAKFNLPNGDSGIGIYKSAKYLMDNKKKVQS